MRRKERYMDRTTEGEDAIASFQITHSFDKTLVAYAIWRVWRLDLQDWLCMTEGQGEFLFSSSQSRAIFVVGCFRQICTMYLMFYLDDAGKRVYTLKKRDPEDKRTESAHPARFSPDDKYSRERIVGKQRTGLLLTQQPAKPL